MHQETRAVPAGDVPCAEQADPRMHISLEEPLGTAKWLWARGDRNRHQLSVFGQEVDFPAVGSPARFVPTVVEIIHLRSDRGSVSTYT